MEIGFDDIKAGDRVTINYPLRGRDTVAQQGTGTAVMRSPRGGWVLNMGGAHGRPGSVDARNFVKATRAEAEA